MESYKRHKLDEEAQAERDSLPARFARPDSIDNWHHERMLGSLAPLLKHARDTTWMTVGDGRFGSDANYLMGHVAAATATSISGSTLALAKARDWITAFSEENVENISFADESFDWVLCKETYHHLPRPAIGFYEMLRVARQGIVLIEPVGGGANPLGAVKRWVKGRIRGEYASDQFEPVGNYIFRVDLEEIAKMLTALNHRTFAWRTMNTFWTERFAGARRDEASAAWLATRAGVLAQDVASRLGLLAPGLVTLICFKREPAPELVADLCAGGFSVVSLPVNPYLSPDAAPT
jgi:SAM-dependent methyltransferase